MKFTFKTTKSTGQYRSFYKDLNEIKLNKKCVGTINEDGTSEFTITLQVIKKDIMEDNNPNCTWKNVTFKNKFKSKQDAKDFLNKNIEKITKQFEIYLEK